jgi:hypothetical protein
MRGSTRPREERGVAIARAHPLWTNQTCSSEPNAGRISSSSVPERLALTPNSFDTSHLGAGTRQGSFHGDEDDLGDRSVRGTRRKKKDS